MHIKYAYYQLCCWVKLLCDHLGKSHVLQDEHHERISQKWPPSKVNLDIFIRMEWWSCTPSKWLIVLVSTYPRWVGIHVSSLLSGFKSHFTVHDFLVFLQLDSRHWEVMARAGDPRYPCCAIGTWIREMTVLGIVFIPQGVHLMWLGVFFIHHELYLLIQHLPSGCHRHGFLPCPETRMSTCYEDCYDCNR